MNIFQSQEYLKLYSRHFARSGVSVVEGPFEILPTGKAVLLGMKPVLNNQQITDYGDVPNPTTDGVNAAMQTLRLNHNITSVQFDYVPEDSRLFSTLSHISAHPPVKQEVAPFICIPPTWETYLESLERTDRKELKRKLRRLDSVQHQFRFDVVKNNAAFEDFIRLHRLADNAKHQFMSDHMKSFFHDFYTTTIPQWQVKLAFLDIAHQPTACIFYFESDREYLLYNSGYDPQFRFYSAGLLLAANLIKQAIENEKKKLDFLRGNERYKYDLGAKDRALFQFTLSF